MARLRRRPTGARKAGGQATQGGGAMQHAGLAPSALCCSVGCQQLCCTRTARRTWPPLGFARRRRRSCTNTRSLRPLPACARRPGTRALRPPCRWPRRASCAAVRSLRSSGRGSLARRASRRIARTGRTSSISAAPSSDGMRPACCGGFACTHVRRRPALLAHGCGQPHDGGARLHQCDGVLRRPGCAQPLERRCVLRARACGTLRHELVRAFGPARVAARVRRERLPTIGHASYCKIACRALLDPLGVLSQDGTERSLQQWRRPASLLDAGLSTRTGMADVDLGEVIVAGSGDDEDQADGGRLGRAGSWARQGRRNP